MKKIILFLSLCILFIHCNQEPEGDLKPLDLLEWGLPMTIMAPDSAKVKTMDLGGVLKDITITGENNYSLQIYATAAATTDVARVKASQLAEVKGNPYFSKIISEEESGFIYENVVDTENLYYGFRHIRIQGDMEYIFQTGLVGSFSLEEVEKMYNAVKPSADN